MIGMHDGCFIVRTDASWVLLVVRVSVVRLRVINLVKMLCMHGQLFCSESVHVRLLDLQSTATRSARVVTL
jgi:2-succinyl-5-enolpyruvyl-6-hydroxy-3-cyclohexene-1-carboxylate synthase